MADLNADQRNYFYLFEADRAGIHKPILAALYVAHQSPALGDGEKGLGIAPANRIPADQVNSFPEQVQYAANTVRSITDKLTAQGWKGNEIWDTDLGRYSDRFVQALADGYVPPPSDRAAARLEPTDDQTLLKAYLSDISADFRGDVLPQNLAYLDRNLLSFIERLPSYYVGLPYQRDALLETVRIWRKLDTRQDAVNAMRATISGGAPNNPADEGYLDRPLLQFLRNLSPNFTGFPHQREAMLRLVQLWRQLDSREAAIDSLKANYSAETNIDIVDPALVSFVQRLPQYYQGKGDQRNALTETFRLWKGLDSRASALDALGVSSQVLSSANPTTSELQNAAKQLDRQLLEFIKNIPHSYEETPAQREALIRLVQLWRGLGVRDQTVQSLFEDIRRMQQARRDSVDAAPRPEPPPLPRRPDRWTTDNIQLYASIIPNGNFTWAEATRGGTRMPPNQDTVDAMIRIAKMAQQARDRIGRPFQITSWYRPPDVNRRVGGASRSRHMVGDAIDFYCDGLTGNQLYWALDAWWPGGLGRYSRFPNLSHIDARDYRARWKH
jgi:Peptidase M15